MTLAMSELCGNCWEVIIIIIKRMKLLRVEHVFIRFNISKIITNDLVTTRRTITNIRRRTVMCGDERGWGISFAAPNHPPWNGAESEKAPARSQVCIPGLRVSSQSLCLQRHQTIIVILDLVSLSLSQSVAMAMECQRQVHS